MPKQYQIKTWDDNTKKFDNIWYYCEHPFENCSIPEGATKLIIGSFPTAAHNYEKTFKYFYGGESNRFWNVMQGVYPEKKFQHQRGDLAVEERRNLLWSNSVGITDMLSKCLRKNKKSQDIDLYPISFMDIFSLLRSNTQIRRLILTSKTELVGTLGLLKLYFLQQGRFPSNFTEGNDRILRSTFIFEERLIQIFVAQSPSSSNDHVKLPELIAMYNTCLK